MVTGVAIANLGDVEAADSHRKGTKSTSLTSAQLLCPPAGQAVGQLRAASPVEREEEEGGRRDSSVHPARSHCDSLVVVVARICALV